MEQGHVARPDGASGQPWRKLPIARCERKVYRFHVSVNVGRMVWG